MTYPTWRDDAAFKRTHNPCPACNDTWEIAYGSDSVECPLHGAPLAKIPADMAARIQANVERELGITPPIVSADYLAAVDRLERIGTVAALVFVVGIVAAIVVRMVLR